MTADGAPLHKFRIVIADDNRDIADSFAMLLQMDGHDVTVAIEGVGALHAIENGLPDVALMDIGMPGLDGYEVARRIRAKGLNSIALIAMTGWGQPADKEKALAAGFDHHLTKPVEPEALNALLLRIRPR